MSLRHLLLLLALTAATSANAEVSVRDDVGNTVRLAAPAKRIVSLAPHMTELLYAAGAGERLVGAVEYSDYPPAAQKIPRVGGYSRLDLEAIAALKPDLIVAWESGNSSSHVSKLRGLGLPVFVSQPNHMEDVATLLERLATLAGSEAVGKAEAGKFRQRLAGLRSKYASRPVVRTFYQIWKQPLKTVGKGQIIGDAIAICGGDNVFGQLTTLAPDVSIEAVLAANPETIIASGMGESRPDWLDDWKRWPQLQAVKRDNLFFVPPELIQRHTPRLLDGTEMLCKHLETVRSHRPGASK